MDPSDINNAPFLWHKGEDFQKAGTVIPLMYRMGTSADLKPPKGQKFSRYLWKMPVKKVYLLCILSAHVRSISRPSIITRQNPDRQTAYPSWPHAGRNLTCMLPVSHQITLRELSDWQIVHPSMLPPCKFRVYRCAFCLTI